MPWGACLGEEFGDFRNPPDMPSSGYDFLSVMTHEVGHLISLAHAGPEADASTFLLTMYTKTYPTETHKRTLGLGDLLGLDALSQGRPVGDEPLPEGLLPT